MCVVSYPRGMLKEESKKRRAKQSERGEPNRASEPPLISQTEPLRIVLHRRCSYGLGLEGFQESVRIEGMLKGVGFLRGTQKGESQAVQGLCAKRLSPLTVWAGEPQILNLKLQTPNPEPQTPNPEPQSLNPQPQTPNLFPASPNTPPTAGFERGEAFWTNSFRENS